MNPPLLKNQLTLSVEEPTLFRRAATEALRTSNPWLSKRAATEILAEGLFTTAKGIIHERTLLPPGTLVVHLDEKSAERAQLNTLEPSDASHTAQVLFDSDDFWILNKRSGQASVALRFWDQRTLTQDALALDPSLSVQFKNRLELGAVHRLDQGTSGCFLFAKNQRALESLRTLFVTRDISKIYTAWAWSRSSYENKVPRFIHDPIVQLKKTSRKVALQSQTPRASQDGAEALPARTEILQMERLTPEIVRVQVRIETGVRHQIRIHLASVGLPLLGDEIYDRHTESRPATLRLGLHASKLGFHWNGIPIETNAPDPSLDDLLV
jgi:23S rRNA pseudouridine1911/1915/1917 synthase